jgi:hypothetical protein
MGQIDPTTWSAIFAAAIISICFSFFATFIVQTWLRIEDLSLKMGKITKEKALERYILLLKSAAFAFVILLLVVLVAYVLTFILSSPPSISGNTTSICENCTYPVSNVINNYNVTVIAACEKGKSPGFSINELKYLIQKKPRSP